MSSGTSNNCTAEGTRNTGQFRISSGWIYTSEPVRTNAQHKEPGLLGSFASIRGGSTLLNLPEPLCYRGNKAYMVNLHEFGVVQCFRTCSNHCAAQETRPVGGFPMSVGWFNFTKPPQTTVVLWEKG